MPQPFREICEELRRPHARACFRKAISYNRFAHASMSSCAGHWFKIKTSLVETAIRLALEALYIDDFQLGGGGIVGVTFPGVGRLHVRLGNLANDIQEFVWNQIRLQCSPTSSSVA